MMDIIDFFSWLIAISVIGGLIYGAMAWQDYRDIRSGGLKVDASDMQIMHGKGMNYKASIDNYMIGWVDSPCTVVITDKAELLENE